MDHILSCHGQTENNNPCTYSSVEGVDVCFSLRQQDCLELNAPSELTCLLRAEGRKDFGGMKTFTIVIWEALSP